MDISRSMAVMESYGYFDQNLKTGKWHYYYRNGKIAIKGSYLKERN